MTGYTEWVERAALAVEALAALLIFASVMIATIAWLARSATARGTLVATYKNYRRRLGRALLVGLEILVAADIIRTVVLEPNLRSIAGLGLLVLIRTFLSWSITLEIEGRWPWEAAPDGPRESE